MRARDLLRSGAGRSMTLSVWMLGLMTLGCGDSETPPCADGFVKKQGRWCVFDEAALGLTDGEPDPADLPDGEGGAGSGGGETSEDEVDEYVFDPEEPEVSLDLTEIEWAMEEVENPSDQRYSEREKEVLDRYLELNAANSHKMNPIPVFQLSRRRAE